MDVLALDVVDMLWERPQSMLECSKYLQSLDMNASPMDFTRSNSK